MIKNLRRLLLILACLLVAAILVGPPLVVWSVLYTNAGLNFVVRHLPRHLDGVQLTISGISGTAATGLEVERVEIDHALVHLRFEGIRAHVALAPLLLQTIRVSDGSVERAWVQVKRRTRPSTPGAPSFMPRWLMVSAEDAQVGHATLTVYNGFRLEVTELRGAAIIRHSYIRFFQAAGRLSDAQVSAIGELRARDPLGLKVEGHLEWSAPGSAGWTVDGSASGDLNLLDVTAHVQSPFRADVSGKALDLTGHWHWLANAVVRRFDPGTFGAGSPLGSITGQLAGSGDEHGFSAHGPLNPEGLHAGVFDVLFTGNYAAHVLSARRMQVRHLASGARVSAAGTIAFVEHGPRLELSGDWDDFRWPLTGREPAVRSAAGAFTLAGALPYKVHVTGRGRAGELPEMPVEVRGTLDRDSIVFDAAQLGLYGGSTDFSGRVVWAPQQSWALRGRATGINPAALRPDLPGSLSFAFDASGRGFGARGDLSATFSNVSGKLRGVAAGGAGTVTHAGNTWGFSKVRVALGGASLALDGRISERVDLRFAVSAPDLSLLAPGSRGHLKASGTVSGTRADPTVVLSAQGGNFEYQGVSLQSLDADVSFMPGASEQESKIDARLQKLTYQARTVDSITLTLAGPPSAYHVHLAASATGLAVSAQASGPYAQGVFSGQLEALSISGSQELRLALERPVGLTVSLQHARIEWLCLLGSPGSVCADGDWTPAAWSTTVMMKELPLATLTAGMTPAVQYQGTISALTHLSGSATAPVQGSLRAQLTDAAIDHRLASRKVEHTPIGSGTISATASPSAINADLLIGESGGVGTIRGSLEVQRTTPEWRNMPLSGELHAHTSELGLVTLYVPEIDRAAGTLDADLAVKGTLGAPSLAGVIKLADGAIDVYQVNLTLRQIGLQATLASTGIDFSGSAHAGAGEVGASGHLEWRQLLPYGQFHLKGSNLRIADVPEAQIDASPDLDFNVSGRRIEVTGKVEIPYAKIQPKDITNAVRVSPDEVIVGSEEEEPGKRFEVVSTVTLVLGDRVNLDAMGLTARLVGSVTVRSGYDAITRGSGELSVASGQYAAYARKLDIQRGRLLFNGGPIDDPGIDVKAQKQFPDVTAGVNVRGTLTQPRLSFFSDPPLPQSQIVSLILAGGSLQSSQNPTTAALGQGAALLAAELGPRAFVPDVSVETDPIANETSLVLGRYLSPRLYVSYGVSLTEQLNTFKLRYTLGDHWTVRTEVGQARGADLVYTIEK